MEELTGRGTSVRWDVYPKTLPSDTEVAWYDFGGGELVLPTAGLLNGDTNKSYECQYIAALVQVRKGKFYFRTIEFNSDQIDHTEFLKKQKVELMSVFLADVERLSTQETK